MTRLIDSDAIDKRYVPIAPVIEGDAVHYEWIAFVEDINEQPTIDAIPVSWIEERIINAEDAGQDLLARMWRELINGYKRGK